MTSPSLCRLVHLTLATAAALLVATPAIAQNLRVVEYNIDCSDQGNNDNINGPMAGVPTVIQAIGNHHIGNNAQPADVFALTELLDTNNNNITSTTLPALVTALNSIYGAGTYAYDTTPDPTSGGTQFNGPSGLIYNTHTVQVVSARALPRGTNVVRQSSGTYAGASGAGSGGNVPRAPMVYQLRAKDSSAAADFYMYVSHARAGSDTNIGSARYAEAQEVRSDANYLLPSGAHIIYSGDWNLFNGNNANGSPNGTNAENAYLCLTGQTTSDGINWAGSTQAYDPTSPTTTTTTWTNSDSSGASKYLYTESTTSLNSRLDVQLVSGSMLNAAGLQLAPDASDPLTNNFPSSKYSHAYEVFGNNGSTAVNARTNLSTNTSLSDLPNATTVLNDLMEPYSGNNNTSVGSDHLPLVADYTLLLPGDFNRDGHVDSADIQTMMAALSNVHSYQTAKGLTDSQLLTLGDLNNDHQFTNADLQMFLTLLKAGNGSSDPVPEPASACLAILAFATMGLRALWPR